MIPYYDSDGIQLFLGDCRDVLPTLADCSVDSIVTDPPYELGFMGKSWDRSGIAYQVEVWRECLRVLKPGGYLLAFGGSRTHYRLGCAIEDAGFELRDTITWLFGSGFPKSLDVSKAIDAAAGAERSVVVGINPHVEGRQRRTGGGVNSGGDTKRLADDARIFEIATDAAKQWNGWGTALKPAAEYIVMARKPLDGTVAENVLKHGTGGINVDGCRVETDWTSDPTRRGWQGRELSHEGGAVSFVDHNKSESQPHDLGRWPANVIHDGSDEVLEGFPETQSGERNGFQGRRIGSRVYHDYVGFEGQHYDASFGSAARFFYAAKASKEDREEGLDDLPIRSAGEVTDRQDGSDGLNSPRAGAGRTNGSRNGHPTVKPTELMRYLVRLVTPPNGTVLDPFGGSGSTAKACAMEDFKAILIEKEIEYCEIAMRRAQLRQRRLLFA